ncbi:MAG: SAM-dependent methyltransferase [Acidimicrobiales bacterium mtb01]|nr:class I SAM-dependent methyltransferase [Actinomycetota bacterium]TEX47348.1 MAG: SAM-dependent methyltransferase [Acidimicrobiales bacterium mtb01]
MTESHRIGDEVAPESRVPGEHVSARWAEWRRSVDLDKYDARWESMAARGESVHGEADALARLVRDHFGGRALTVLDAGCGTGRLGIELDRRGHRVIGVDLDPDMIERARRKAPGIEWHAVDLATFTTDRRFDIIVMAGNIPNFCAPGDQARIVANLARLLAPGGLLVAGWSQESRADSYHADRFIAEGEANSLALASAWKNWDGDAFDDSDYAVVVLAGRD